MSERGCSNLHVEVVEGPRTDFVRGLAAWLIERSTGTLLLSDFAAGIGAAIVAQLVEEGCQAVYVLDIVAARIPEGVSNKQALQIHQVQLLSSFQVS